MPKFVFILALLSASVSYSQVYQFNNGNWWIKGRFEKKTIYSDNGYFTFKKPSSVDSVIDLKNQYCTPPFGDAHTHNLDGSYALNERIKQYLNEGVFYVQVLGNRGTGAVYARQVLAKQKTLEATYANGLLTAKYGHGFYPYEPLDMGIYSPADQIKYADSIKKSRISENNAYYFLDSIADVDAKWPLIKKYNPDHLKICLLDAADYPAKRKAEGFDNYGLSPEVATYIVQKAHAEGYRVFAHVETADDARLCAKIGVDALAHLPGYGWDGKEENREKYCITEQDVKLLKKSGITIIPTLNIDHTTKYIDGKLVYNYPAKLRSMQYESNIMRQLYKHKVPIALGGDYFGKTVEPEIDSIIANNIFSGAELIDIWSRQTVQHIFPKRKIGEIKQSYEASFIVFENDPTKNISAIKKVRMRFKNGKFITL